MNGARLEFGPSLKARRENRGVTLQSIADSTKISLSLLVALERNDLSRWPRGIFRRAYYREYVAAIGLPPEPLLTEFTRLFPDHPLAEPVDGDEPAVLTLALEVDADADRRKAWLRAATAIGELSVVVTIGFVAAYVTGADEWTASGVAGLIYYPVANLCVERTLRVRGLSSLIAYRPFESSTVPSSDRERQDGELTPTPELGTVSN